MNPVDCHNCSLPLAADDNFCRRCGISLHPIVPAVRTELTPAVWRPHIPPVMKGAAVMAAGTIGQYVFRRVAREFLGGDKPRSPRRRRASQDGMLDEAQIITETVMLRRVRIRRQA